MNKISTNNMQIGLLARVLRPLLLALSVLSIMPVQAALDIKGDVYGGGKSGNVGVEGNPTSTTVGIYGAEIQIRTVFGGGQDGKVYGTTNVNIEGGTIGAEKFNGSLYGGVYGGGEGAEAIVSGTANVNMTAGDVVNNIYGGGKMAALQGNTNVEISGGTVSGSVFGGACMADIQGRTYVWINGVNELNIGAVYGGNDISGNISSNASVVTNPYSIPVQSISNGENWKNWNAFVRVTESAKGNVNIGSLFGGGNGDYGYNGTEGNYSITLKDFAQNGDSITRTLIVSNRPTLGKVLVDVIGGKFNAIYGGGNNATVTGSTDIYLNGENVVATNVFGGNNLATMAIRPTWHLYDATITNLYSGGNRGDMTSQLGLLLAIESANLTIENVYGGCRMANVTPATQPGVETYTTTGGKTISFDGGYAARVYIGGGKIKNVYGGNDISGTVKYGANVEIYSSISGSIYGAGNGAYLYTDKTELVKSNPEFADFYYNPGFSSVDALYAYRPKVEKTLLHIAGPVNANGEPEGTPLYVAGNVFCGGNSAPLKSDDKAATTQFRIGKNVVINGVFLGSNGEQMVRSDVLAWYANNDNSSIDLTKSDQMKRYMDGVSVNLKPSFSVDWKEELTPDQTRTYIGSLYLGGNVGSLTTTEQIDVTIPSSITIYEKIVGGSNNAIVAANAGINAEYVGGVTERSSGDYKLKMTVASRMEPKKLIAERDGEGYVTDASLEWNKAKPIGLSEDVLAGANVYGGCYQSGVVNGNVVIDITDNLISPNIITNELYTYNDGANKIGEYVFTNTISVFGGGYGENSTINGNTTINLTDNARVFKVFGGGELGGVTGNTSINLANNLVQPEEEHHYNAFKVYGGGLQGNVDGTASVSVQGGKFYDIFGGSCFADIDGTAKVVIGSAQSAGSNNPINIVNNVYGANDFGGTVKRAVSFGQYGYGNKYVKAQTMVQYYSGIVQGNIFGGANGAYNYDEEFQSINMTGKYPVLNTAVTETAANFITANTFVHIASPSTRVDGIKGAVYGGGQGFSGSTGIVDVKDTYVHLAATGSYQDRVTNGAGPLVSKVFGGAYYSYVENTTVDAASGYYDEIYGGTFGATHTTLPKEISYDCGTTNVNVYGMNNLGLNVYGAGAKSGAQITNVNLSAGNIGYAYGGSFAEGYCETTNVTVPETSTIRVKAIYGGSVGSEEGLPCDVGQSNVKFASSGAFITGEGLFGGNKSYRATKKTNVLITAPVHQSADVYADVYASGHGENTVTGYALVTLDNRALVRNVYGGALDGTVRYAYDDKSGADEYYTTNSNKYAHWEYKDPKTKLEYRNTRIIIERGATVKENVFGGGYGETATVYGATSVSLLGGIVEGDIYGGGSRGNMKVLSSSDTDKKVLSILEIYAGKVRRVFGGGLEGYIEGESDVTIGLRKQVVNGALSEKVYKNTELIDADIDWGKPAILRSAYGGGERGKVTNTNITMNNGYVGYDYDYNTGKYFPNVKLHSQDDLNLLANNGNLYGGGFGDKAWVVNTNVEMYGGTIRHSLYGGGEIASVGFATMKVDDGVVKEVDWDEDVVEGSTKITMYGGTVERDVFGGGRGFSYTLAGALEVENIYYSSGFVFGKTEVNLHRGNVGTDATLKEGAGNVFGGGNIGYVYSVQGKKDVSTGHYYDGEGNLTEDCKVLITPVTVALDNFKIGSNEYTHEYTHEYTPGDFVPCTDLNTLLANDERWAKMDEQGITIRNAVFAGGNVIQGTDIMTADAKTVFGNVTASVVDVFDCDMVSVSTENIGGFYGDGNLSLVDGYRELNITNYGTDYHNLTHEIKYEDYARMHPRKKAYYELKYICLEDHPYVDANGKTHWYVEGDQISGSVWGSMPSEEQVNWKLAGLATLYAGRMINTIQRADFCGVWGSRVVLKGARDRETTTADFTLYTINRLDELSLNEITDYPIDDYNPDGTKDHGCYFGIYNVVNRLGAVSSSVDYYTAVRVTENGEEAYKPTREGEKYYEFKNENAGTKFRNNGKSANIIALAGGVWLEIVKDIDEQTGEKDYGPITGVIQLDLINVAVGEGGGYVYADNIHGTRTPSGANNVTLAESNKDAVSYKRFAYSDDQAELELYASSGNFVHSFKQIVDDCYPNNGDKTSPAHYWYVRGDFYVYNQTISAYTGTPQSYSETVSIPLSITAGANGKLQLLSVDDSYYAYYEGLNYGDRILTADDSVRIAGQYYHTNDPISSWDYNRLAESEKAFFTKTTYVCIDDVLNIDGETKDINGIDLGALAYKKGKVILPSVYETLKSSTEVKIHDPEGTTADAFKEVPVSYFFHPTNNMGKNEGFLLTYKMNNPAQWDGYYSEKTGEPYQITLAKYDDKSTIKENYVPGPSFLNIEGGIFGQYTYNAGDIINHNVYKEQQDLLNDAESKQVGVTGQAKFDTAYVATENVHVKTIDNGQVKDMFVTVGNVISATDFGSDLNKDVQNYFKKAVLCIQTFEKAEEEWCYNGDIIPVSEYDELINTNSEFKNYFSIDTEGKPITWLCTKTGKFGGHLFIKQNSYDALQYAGVQPEERKNFTFNKDAFDLLSTNFNVNLNNYDPLANVDPNTENDGKRYSGPTRVDYTAKYIMEGNDLTVTDLGISDIYGDSLSTISQGVELNNVNFEKLPNEKRKFAKVNVTDEHLRVDNSVEPAKKKNALFYVVKNTFKVGDSYYTRGRVLIDTVYEKLKVDENTAKESVMKYSFAEKGVYYVCVDGFTNRNDLDVLNSDNGEYKLTGVTTRKKSAGTGIAVGDVITEDSYDYRVVNMQTGFQVQGTMPTETSTLYVPRSADVRDLSEDKIVTVVYEYTYLESDQAGVNFEEITERHIVNIRVHFESGVPKIGDLQTPQTVLPGDVLGMNTPTVTPGAYEIMSGGFEIFSNEHDAFAHKNGVAYQQGRAPLYWYQNEYWIAYYAKTYLGKTYSSPVRLSVANYHRLKDVLDHPEYMFVDSITDTYSGNPAMLRNPKIYINDDVYTENRDGAEVQLNEFDYLIELYNEHLIYGKQVGIKQITGRNNNGQIQYAKNLEFILQSNVEPLYYKDKEWKLGNSSSADNCFQGNLHGDGYTIGGLTHSLFNKLCGNVYNLGVTGSFTGAGISDNGGAVYNSWVSTSAIPTTAPVIASGGSVINSYYNSAQYAAGNYSNGATAASTREFADGTVAYKLNGYYQQKRSDITSNKKRSGSDGAYLQNNGTSTFPTIHEITGSESSSSLYGNVDYVEERMKTGDFRYEKGEVPYRVGEIRYVDGNPDEGTAAKFVPIYPDDYIFFGQNLTYGLVQGKDHNDNPMRIEKRTYSYSNTVDDVTIDYEPELIDAVTDADNRVFRAPSYTAQSPTTVAGGVHYNRNAVFTDTYKEMVIDRDVTAIDFTGAETDGSGFNNTWLDFDGVKSIYLKGLTRNMLIYADASQEDSYSVLMEAANEPELNVNPEKSYNTVAVVQETAYPLFHLVGKQLNSEYRAATSQFLVDKQNFAAPKAYSFNDGYYMWYQRRPAYYANSSTDGWEGLILPFTADLVTTQDKGEITHFYGNSDKGHEYWLRGFTGVETAGAEKKAQFVRPKEDVGYEKVEELAVANSYLYDKYYSKNSRNDVNADDYFEYYNTTRTYKDYLLTTANIPYIVAYPGVTYYEFDMSGNFVADNTATPAPAKLDAQVVTYVSKEGQNIEKYSPSVLTSDRNGYILYGSYLNTPAAASGSFYKIDANGSGFAVSSDNTEAAVPFRVYLKTNSQGAPTRGDVLEYIPIGGDADYIAEQAPLRGLNIYGKNHVIYIESSLDFETVVTVYSTSGQIIARVDVAPGATVKVPVNATGVYIVNRKKVMI